MPTTTRVATGIRATAAAPKTTTNIAKNASAGTVPTQQRETNAPNLSRKVVAHQTGKATVTATTTTTTLVVLGMVAIVVVPKITVTVKNASAWTVLTKRRVTPVSRT